LQIWELKIQSLLCQAGTNFLRLVLLKIQIGIVFWYKLIMFLKIMYTVPSTKSNRKERRFRWYRYKRSADWFRGWFHAELEIEIRLIHDYYCNASSFHVLYRQAIKFSEDIVLKFSKRWDIIIICCELDEAEDEGLTWAITLGGWTKVIYSRKSLVKRDRDKNNQVT